MKKPAGKAAVASPMVMPPKIDALPWHDKTRRQGLNHATPPTMSKKSPSACECCLMPLDKDPAGRTREDHRYCSYCFSGGQLHAEKSASLAEFQRTCFDAMRARGTPWLLARFFAFTIRFAPYWKSRRAR